jgi:hypothetical protein
MKSTSSFGASVLGATWLAWVVSLGLGNGACGSGVPAQPTWQNDVRPLLVARCIRCHDDPPRGDPGAAMAEGNFNYQTVDDVVAAAGALGILQTVAPMRVHLSGTLHMPPAPAASLQDWEAEILDNWGRETPPR